MTCTDHGPTCWRVKRPGAVDHLDGRGGPIIATVPTAGASLDALLAATQPADRLDGHRATCHCGWATEQSSARAAVVARDNHRLVCTARPAGPVDWQFLGELSIG